MATQTTTRSPLPPFTPETAIQKVRLAEDGWNTRDPAKVALAYAIDSRWRNRSEFINGRNEIIAFLSRKWSKELDYRLGCRDVAGGPRGSHRPRAAMLEAEITLACISVRQSTPRQGRQMQEVRKILILRSVSAGSMQR